MLDRVDLPMPDLECYNEAVGLGLLPGPEALDACRPDIVPSSSLCNCMRASPKVMESLREGVPRGVGNSRLHNTP